jgi:photosystem II stability/assembly factor-like uncharacterized protein
MGVAYLPAPDNPSPGVFKTTNGGADWTLVGTTQANGLVGTPTTLYSTFGWAATAPWNAVDLQTAPRTMDTSWTSDPIPAGMINGWKRVSVTFDGTHHILVGGFWLAGIWLYVEP